MWVYIMGVFLKFEMAITKIYNDKTAQKNHPNIEYLGGLFYEPN